MPLREYVCPDLDCKLYNYRRERYEHTTPPPAPKCVECGVEMEQVMSAFAVTFAGEMSARYNDPKKEFAHKEGEWQLSKKSPGGPKWEYINTWQRRKEWMKQEGLEECGPMQAGDDGKSANGRGLPGAWI